MIRPLRNDEQNFHNVWVATGSDESQREYRSQKKNLRSRKIFIDQSNARDSKKVVAVKIGFRKDLSEDVNNAAGA